MKLKRANLDVTFVWDWKVFKVIPKFLTFVLPNTNDSDSRFIKKRLIRSTLKKKNERYKLDKELWKISIEACGMLSSLVCYIIRALIKKNIKTNR